MVVGTFPPFPPVLHTSSDIPVEWSLTPDSVLALRRLGRPRRTVAVTEPLHLWVEWRTCRTKTSTGVHRFSSYVPILKSPDLLYKNVFGVETRWHRVSRPRTKHLLGSTKTEKEERTRSPTWLACQGLHTDRFRATPVSTYRRRSHLPRDRTVVARISSVRPSIDTEDKISVTIWILGEIL